MFNFYAETLKQSARILQLESELARAQAALAAALTRQPEVAPIDLGQPVAETFMYWLTTKEEWMERFRGSRYAPPPKGRYTSHSDVAEAWVGQGNRAQLVKVWKTADGRVLLKDPASITLPLGQVYEGPVSEPHIPGLHDLTENGK